MAAWTRELMPSSRPLVRWLACQARTGVAVALDEGDEVLDRLQAAAFGAVADPAG